MKHAFDLPESVIAGDKIITKGDDAGRTECELAEIVFNPDVSDLDYFKSRLAHFKRKEREASSVEQERNESR